MNSGFDSNKPIFLQIREKIEDQIINKQILEEEQAPSTNQLVNFYKINHATVAKGVNQLVDEGILYKKRGIGMFVSKGAREKLIGQRKDGFVNEFIIPLIREARKLNITEDDILEIINNMKGSDSNEL